MRAARARPVGLADQGHRRCRERAHQPARGIRARGRPCRHRRPHPQRSLHRGIAAIHARTHGRERARHAVAHQERRGGFGHGHAAAFRAGRIEDRRAGVRAGRCDQPAGRHVADIAAARDGRSDLRGRARLARRIGLQGTGRRRQHQPGRVDFRADRLRRDRGARGALCARRGGQPQAGAQEPRFHDRQARRAGDQPALPRGCANARSGDGGTAQRNRFHRIARRAAARDRESSDRCRSACADRRERGGRHRGDDGRREDQSGRSGASLAMLDQGTSLQSLVNGLNRLGVSPRDLITILHALKSAGALQAEITIQ